jgi:hypothetical protein
MNAPVLCTSSVPALPSSAFPWTKAFIDNWSFPPRRPRVPRPMKNWRKIKKDQPKETKSEVPQECGAPVDNDKKNSPASPPSTSLSRACKVINPLPDEKEPTSLRSSGKELPVSLGSVKKTRVAPNPPVAKKCDDVESKAPTSRRRSAKKPPVAKLPVAKRERDENKAPTARRSVKKPPVVKPPAVMVLQREHRVQPAPASRRRSNKKPPAVKPPVVILQREHLVQEQAPMSRRSVQKTPVVKLPVVVLQRENRVQENAPVSRRSIKKPPVVKLPVVVLQRENRVQENAPVSRRSIKKPPVIKPPPGFLQREHHVQDKAHVSRRSVQKPPVDKPVVVLQRAGHQNVPDKVSATNTDKAPPGFFTKSKCTEPEADKVSAAWAHHQALSAIRNENAYKIPAVIFTNPFIVPDDAVSRLYYDPDIDDEDALPPATIAVLENFFDGIDSDLEETDDESSLSSAALEQDFFYSKTVPADYSPSYLHFDFGMMEV